MMFAVTAILVLITMGLALFRAIRGPSVFDRILSVNSFGTLTVLLISVYGFMTDRPEFLDIALVYALITFIGTIAITKFISAPGLGHPIDRDDFKDV
jgi:multicomponent Na+:H+ antiporter subunit F